MVLLSVTLLASAAWSKEFVTMPAGNNPFPNVVAIAIPPNCPGRDAEYGRSLEAALKAKKVPVRVISEVKFNFNNQSEARQIQSMMESQPGPHVFLNNKMLGHPTVDEVVAEIQRTYSEPIK